MTIRFTGIQPDRPPDFAPRGGMSLEQAGRLRELKDRARLSGISYAIFVDFIRRVGLSKADRDIDGRLDMLEELIDRELEKLIDRELERRGGPR